MNVSYFFSSPSGDVPVDAETLARPFIVEPLQTHPFLTLADFFHLVTHFVLGKAAPNLVSALSHYWGQNIALQDIDSAIIRYEKYGSLYQIVSAELIYGNLRAKFGVSAAMTPGARESIKDEYNLLSYFNTKTGLSYLPRVFCIHSQDIRKSDQTDTVILMLAEWFEGYHEWHFSKDEEGRTRIIIWDMGGGQRPASDDEAYAIIKEASFILTSCYSVETAERVFPWHNGAGDFVVNATPGKLGVKLIALRGYEPFTSNDPLETANPAWGMLQFIIELTTRMRLDKLEGMGDTTWADRSFVGAAIDGFLQAMATKEAQGQCGSLNVPEFVKSLKALSQDEVEQAIRLQLAAYQAPDTSDYQAIEAHLQEHANDLVKAFQDLSL